MKLATGELRRTRFERAVRRTACSNLDTLCVMSDPVVYLNGRFVEPSGATLSIFDAGIVHGATLTDRVRTYGGSPFAMDQHLGRFASGLDTLGIELPEAGRLADIVDEVLMRNGAGAERDLAAVLVATPGPPEQRPTLWIHTVVQPGLSGLRGIETVGEYTRRQSRRCQRQRCRVR